MEITPKMDFVEGSFDTTTCEMVCVPRWKYMTVELGIRCDKGSSIVPVAEIKLYDSDLHVDAKATFDQAKSLGEEIARRWNEFSDKR